MNRNWLNLVAIAAALVAGTICSTALADKGGSSGGRVRSFSGGSKPAMQSRVRSSSQFSGGIQRRVKTQPLGGISSGGLKTARTPKFNVQPSVQNLPRVSGQRPRITIGQQTPKIDTKQKIGIGGIGPKVDIQKNGGIAQLLQKVDVQPKSQFGSKVAKVLDPKFCQPGCKPKWDPCHDKCNLHCYPWWWSPCTYTPSYQACQTIYYAQPVVYTVPVAVPVAAAPEPVGVGPVVEEELMQIPSGATLTLQGEQLGEAIGQVVLQFEQISLPVQVNDWKLDGVNATLPMVGLVGPTKAQIWLVKADGSVGANVAVELIPAAEPAPSTEMESAAAALTGGAQ